MGLDREETQGGTDFRDLQVVLLGQSVKYKWEMKLDGPLCGRLVSLDFTLQVMSLPCALF